ncbi:MAG: ABC1 kinase family protein [Bdellovibrionales bacterium]
MSTDKTNIASRVTRYGKVSGTMAGLAAKLAGEKYFGLKIERDEHAQALMQALGNLKGPLMKVGQILATIPEALPPEYARALQELQSNAPSMGWPFVRRRMKTELGQNWPNNFKAFEKEAAAAASLGQVHKAIITKNQFPQAFQPQTETEREPNPARTGSASIQQRTCEPEAQPDLDRSPFIEGDEMLVACKLQYPDMQSAIDADLNQLRIIFRIYGQYDKSIKTDHIYTELSERLREELDYTREAKNTKLYAYMLRDEGHVHVPQIIDDLSTPRLLTSTWLDGDKILTFKDAPQDTRNTIAMNLFRAWYVPLYYYGIIHGDPHLGNYTIRKDLSVNLLDFGCIRIFPAPFVGAVIDLYNALKHKDEALAVHAYETWGFKDLSREQIDTLNIWAEFLYGPLLEDKTRPIGHAKGAVYGRDTAEKVHNKLRELAKDNGGIAVPREFVFMDRAALGLGSVFIHLNAEINWYRVFNELIENFDANAMNMRQKEALNRFGLAQDSTNP